MAFLSIEILNPKVEKLLQDLAEMNLISISETTSNQIFTVVKKLRSKKTNLSLKQITKE